MTGHFDRLPEPLKEHILESVNKRYPRDPNRIWVTDILYCLRKAWYRHRNPKDIPLEQAWKMHHGNLIHHDFESAYGDQEKWELPIYDTGAVLVGKTDSADGTLIVEYKTASDKNDYYLKKEGAKGIHVEQLQLYLHATDRDRGQVIYCMHDHPRVFDVDLEDFDINEYLQRALLLWDGLQEGTPPPKTDSSWECDYCEYEEECQEVDG